MSEKTCIVIVGPTAVGKTNLAIQLARHLGSSVISADSRQCYKELTIGVAKPDAHQLASVKHYFINTHSITDEVNAAVFEAYALHAAAEIFAMNDYAVVVGGTGLYIKAFCEGLDAIPQVPAEIRRTVVENYSKYGIGWLKGQLTTEDYKDILYGEQDNPQRLMRKVEVRLATGRSLSSFQTETKKQRNFNISKIGLDLPREVLYDRINQRVDKMVEDGLIEEVMSLRNYSSCNALQTVGYKELFDYLNNNISRDEAISLIKQHTRHYAKRQLTWFKRDADTRWFDADKPEDVLRTC